MKKKFEEDAAALEQSAEIPAAQSCPVSSSSFTGARYRPNQSPVGLPIPSTESHEETLRKTEPFEEKFKKAEPIEGTHKRADELPYVTQQISQVSLGGTLGEVPENRDQTQPPSLTLGLDGADGSDAASESVERGAESNQQRDVSNTSGNPSLNVQSGMISMRGDPSSRSTFNMKVRRCEVLNDLFDIFHKEKLENILQCKVNAEFAGEANGSGVLLDILSAYWEEFFENYSEGEDEKVLQAHTDLIKDNLKCAGRILRFGFQYCPETEPLQFFPHQLCLASIINVIHPNSISDDMTKYKAIWSASLYAHFGAISGEKIKAIYEDPKSASEGQWQNINNILDDFFEKNYLVNADNIRDKLSHLAEVHLLQKSKTSLELMGFHDWKKLYPEHFGDIDKIVEFSKQFHPTSDDVLKASLLYIPLNVKYNRFRRDFMKIISDEMNQDTTRELSHDQQ
ncbi:hypothetical protein CAPTEDRAFT_228005 [Capitella teleta]|uniref:Uncharacterized protein n=1 Tax=Capitella teleta TaxID=283909 RepID=R7TTK2_CAPTE|nr:hypothetical protein CAPTEDRAFT_228005 [Capitella teleta]|eukprot:ELT97009.1 hypothetical protein CAPTEDRAFT_228005 [Capitella teleta]